MLSFFFPFLFVYGWVLSPDSCTCVMYLHHHALHVQAEEEELKVGMSSNLKPIMQTNLDNDPLTL